MEEKPNVLYPPATRVSIRIRPGTMPSTLGRPLTFEPAYLYALKRSDEMFARQLEVDDVLRIAYTELQGMDTEDAPDDCSFISSTLTIQRAIDNRVRFALSQKGAVQFFTPFIDEDEKESIIDGAVDELQTVRRIVKDLDMSKAIGWRKEIREAISDMTGATLSDDDTDSDDTNEDDEAEESAVKTAKRQATTELPGAKPSKTPRPADRTPSDARLPSIFGENNFLAPLVAQFVGVRSLLRLAATDRTNLSVVAAEVSRRKEKISDIEARVRDLILVPAVPLRAGVLEAHKLCKEAKSLIDSEMDWQDRCNNPYDELSCDDDEVFADQRKLLWVGDCGNGSAGPLYMLPLCFYLPPQGEAAHPDEEHLLQMKHKAVWLWGAEDHMGSFYELENDYPSYDYKYPFRKFEHHLASFFHDECMVETAMDIADTPYLDAFRVAARLLFSRSPNSRDCLHYVLFKADEMTTAETS